MKVIIKDGEVFRDDGTIIPLRSNVKFIKATISDNEAEDRTEVKVIGQPLEPMEIQYSGFSKYEPSGNTSVSSKTYASLTEDVVMRASIYGDHIYRGVFGNIRGYIKSTDGVDWELHDLSSILTGDIYSFDMNRGTGRMIFSTIDEGIKITDDEGESFTTIEGYNFKQIRWVNDKTWLGIESGNVYKSTNNGNDWTQIMTGAIDAKMEVHPKNRDIIFIARSNEDGDCQLSTDGGETWNGTYSLSAVFRNVTISSDGLIYVCKNNGVLKFDVDGQYEGVLYTFPSGLRYANFNHLNNYYIMTMANDGTNRWLNQAGSGSWIGGDGSSSQYQRDLVAYIDTTK